MDVRHITGRGSPEGPRKAGAPGSGPDAGRGSGPSFKEVLNRVGGLEFSKHALERLEDRSISMDSSDMDRLMEAVNRAASKGSRDSLVLDGEKAFLVNIPNQTVVTAVDMMELREKVFTNIDSTVLTRR